MTDADRASGAVEPAAATTEAASVGPRAVVQAGTDGLVWIGAVIASQVLRFDLRPDPGRWSGFGLGGLAVVAVAAAVLQIGIGLALGLYRGRWRYGSFDEVSHLLASLLATTAAISVLNQLPGDRWVPTSVPLLGGALALLAMGGCRYAWRIGHERSLRPTTDTGEPVLVLGAGEGGQQIITAMLRTPSSPYVPVAIVDDDPTKRNLSIRGVPVVGNRTVLGAEAERLHARAIVVAIPSASPELLREVSEVAMRLDLEVRVLPPIHELFGSPLGLSDIRPLSEVDLLGRHEVDTDVDSIAGYLTGRRVLITGAGGSIGSELCRQISRFAPAELVMLDRDESALHAVQLSIEGRALLDSENLVVADLRDADRIDAVLARHRPQVVFHTAALKHLPLLELHPDEALKSNVWGTQHLLAAACRHGVDRFVNISTDKAADPVSVLGTTKRIAERLTAAAAADCPGTYLSVRFGNVLGSRGSVLTTFRAQIEAGGPVTVTDADVTRYFMTVEEAVQLVIQAGAVGGDGEALVLDMGRPVRIDDVARRLVAEAHRPVEIVYTGLRPGEKLHEVLLGQGEEDLRPRHHLISQVPVPTLAIDRVADATAGRTGPDLVAALAALALDPAGAGPGDDAPSQAGRATDRDQG